MPHSKLLKHSSRSKCENSSHIPERAQKSPLKHWIHFLLSSLWPPTSNMLWKDKRTIIRSARKQCTLSVAVWPAAQFPVGPRQTARAQPQVPYQLAGPGCPHPVVSLVSALTLQPSGRLEPTSQSSLSSASLCLSFWLQFLSTYPNALDLSHVLRCLRSWILPFPKLTA